MNHVTWPYYGDAGSPHGTICCEGSFKEYRCVDVLHMLVTWMAAAIPKPYSFWLPYTVC